MPIEDITSDLAPDAASTSPTPEPPTPSSRLGHLPKIRAAVETLEGEGLLPRHLRPVARARVITDWLMDAGYSQDMPGRDAIEREYRRYRRTRERRARKVRHKLHTLSAASSPW